MHATHFENAVEARAGVVTAGFRNAGTALVTSARYVFTLPGGSSGKFQAIARAPNAAFGTNESMARSNVITFNGGASASFPPVIAHASAMTEASGVTIAIAGAGLERITRARIVRADAQLPLELEIAQLSDSTLVAFSSHPTAQEEGVVELSDGGGGTGAAALAPAATCETAQPSTAFFNYLLFADPLSNVSTKDFAFFQNRTKATHKRLYHLFYIRHRDVTGAEPGLAHAWSPDLLNWRVDTCAFLPSGATCAGKAPSTAWDSRDVWAPSLIQTADSTYMLYAGVDLGFDQRVGVAVTSDLDTCNTDWIRRTSPAFSTTDTRWATRRRFSSTFGRQFRDPFVFPHPNPDSAGKYFLVCSQGDTNLSVTSTGTLMGLARNLNPGSLDRWVDQGIYRSTDSAVTRFSTLEGPMLFHDRGSPPRWWSMFTNFNNTCAIATSSVRFERLPAGSAPTDTTIGQWGTTIPPALYSYLGNDNTVWGWNGSEYLKDSDDREFLAGFTAFGQPTGPCPSGIQGIAITQLHWAAPTYRDFTLGIPGTSVPVTAVDTQGSPNTGVGLSLAEYRPLAHRVRWRISLPTALRLRFEIYDVQGRTSRVIMDGPLPAGESIVSWDTADAAGAPVRSGMYYARLSFDGGTRLAALPVVR